MPIAIKPFTFSNGTIADGIEVNTNFDVLYALINGGLDSANIDQAASFVWTGVHSFISAGLQIRDTANDHVYTFTAGGDLASSMSVILPVLLASDTLVFENHIQTLVGKTLTSPTINGGTINSAAVVTPTIASFVNANHTHLDAAGGGGLGAGAITSGTLPVVRGGTGATTSTGSGSVVLSTSPTLTTPTIASFANAQHDHTGAAGGGNLSTAAINSGTFANARISQASVTQHEGALSIAETQIPNGALLARNASNESITGAWSFTDEIALPAIDPPTANRLNQNSIAKAWGKINGTTGAVMYGYNVTSATRTGPGAYRVTLNRDQANIDSPVLVTPALNNAMASGVLNTLTEVGVFIRNDAGAATDMTFNFVVFGLQ